MVNHARGGLSRLLPLRNLWLGTSAGSQATLDTAAPALLSHAQQWGRIAFLSCEPQIEHINLLRYVPSPDGFVAPDLSNGAVHVDEGAAGGAGYFNWIIQGGESGPHARPFHIRWIDQMTAQLADVPERWRPAHFVKQYGSKPVMSDGQHIEQIDHIQSRAGEDPDEWEGNHQIQEFPK